LESPHRIIDDVPAELAIAIPTAHRYIRELCELNNEGMSPFVKIQLNALCALCSTNTNNQIQLELLTWKVLLQGSEAAYSAITQHLLQTVHPSGA